MVADTLNPPMVLWRSLMFRWRTQESTAVRSALNWTRSALPAPSLFWVSLSLTPHTIFDIALLLKDANVLDAPQISPVLLTLWSCLKRRNVVSRCPGCQALKTTVLYLVIEIKSLSLLTTAHHLYSVDSILTPLYILRKLRDFWALFFYKLLIVPAVYLQYVCYMNQSYTSTVENSYRLHIGALYKTLFLRPFSPKGEILLNSYMLTSNVFTNKKILFYL